MLPAYKRMEQAASEPNIAISGQQIVFVGESSAFPNYYFAWWISIAGKKWIPIPSLLASVMIMGCVVIWKLQPVNYL